MVKTADEAMDMEVETISTSFPQLDRILRPVRGGIPRGKHMEVYSRREQCGKTSLMVQIAASCQRQGFTTNLGDVEGSQTKSFHHAMGLSTDPNHPTLCSPLMLGISDTQYSAEQYLNAIKEMSAIVDFIGVDSVAALDSAANLAKDADEAKGMGGIAKLLGENIRNNLRAKATIMWLNQSRQKVGAFSPTGGTVYCQPGGMAIGFFSTVRLELSQIEKLKAPGTEDPIGFKTQIFTAKNRLGPPFRNCKLNYVFGEGFSALWDYMDMGIKLGVITKSGSWYNFEPSNERLGQGFMNAYALIKQTPHLFELLKQHVDGDNAAAELVGELVDQKLEFDPTQLAE
jgi:recombination protein RecA